MLNFDFSPNNSMTEFESPETDSTVFDLTDQAAGRDFKTRRC